MRGTNRDRDRGYHSRGGGPDSGRGGWNKPDALNNGTKISSASSNNEEVTKEAALFQLFRDRGVLGTDDLQIRNIMMMAIKANATKNHYHQFQQQKSPPPQPGQALLSIIFDRNHGIINNAIQNVNKGLGAGPSGSAPGSPGAEEERNKDFYNIEVVEGDYNHFYGINAPGQQQGQGPPPGPQGMNMGGPGQMPPQRQYPNNGSRMVQGRPGPGMGPTTMQGMPGGPNPNPHMNPNGGGMFYPPAGGPPQGMSLQQPQGAMSGPPQNMHGSPIYGNDSVGNVGGGDGFNLPPAAGGGWPSLGMTGSPQSQSMGAGGSPRSPSQDQALGMNEPPSAFPTLGNFGGDSSGAGGTSLGLGNLNINGGPGASASKSAILDGNQGNDRGGGGATAGESPGRSSGTGIVNNAGGAHTSPLQLLKAASSSPLSPPQQNLLVQALRGIGIPLPSPPVLGPSGAPLGPAALLLREAKIEPSAFPQLVDSSPVVAYEVLSSLLKAEQAPPAGKPNSNLISGEVCPVSTDYLNQLVQMTMSMQTMEVVNRLINPSGTTSGDQSTPQSPGGSGSSVADAVPVEFVRAYVSNCIRCCESNKDKYMQNRLVRLVCVFLGSIIRSGVVNISDLYIELQPFCIEFSKIKEAAALYQLLLKTH